jgi:CO/xanthine dehydrogenase FAD-binding subunit
VPVFHPIDVDEAVELLARRGPRRILAGGTDEMVRINHGAAVGEGEEIVCLNNITELRSWAFESDRGVLVIGAAVPWTELASGAIATLCPSLAEAARTVGSPQIRNAGTLGGNVATASPAGDGLCAAVALDAVAVIRSAAGSRRVPVAELVTGPKQTGLGPEELITSFEIPLTEGYQGYAKVGVRNAMVISIAGACLVVDEQHGTSRLALGSVGPTILRCPEAEPLITDVILNRSGNTARLDEIVGSVRSAARPIDDHRATADYRRHAVGVLARRLVTRAISAREENNT